jgi:gamma-glutamyltranspeptidase/glutathione hydrolase
MMRNLYQYSFLLWLFTSYGIAQDRITGELFATRSEVIAQNGMAATSQPLATQVALDILKKGGSAIDAAIGANAVLGLVEPTGCGIGGDLFAMVWDAKTKQLHGLNACGRSPKSLTLEYFKKNNLSAIPSFGVLPVSVPGAVDGWFELHKKFGRLPLKEILQPAIDYAEKGFPVTELIAYYLESSYRRFKDYPNFKETYTVDNKPITKGAIFKNPALAKTYRLLAEKGRDEFYKGSIAKTIDAFMKKNSGFLSLEDLANHTSEWIQPVSTTYKGHQVWELPPNGQGIVALQMLNILEPYNLGQYGFGSPEHIHYFVEAKKLVFEDRAKLYGDPAFNKIPVGTLISKEYAETRRKLITERAGKNYDAGLQFGKETIYMTVADKDGNMISLIQSNYRGMGSGMIPDGLGFMLHDRGECFSLTEGHPNCYTPQKRPFHTIIPAFVTKDGQPFLSFGVMGGDFQPLGHTQIILNILEFGMNFQEAGDAPRIDHTGSSSPFASDPAKDDQGGQILLESGFSYETIRELLKRGHKIGYGFGGYGGYQAIGYDATRKVYYGASESRKDGQAAGY